MSWITTILRELLGLFVDDGALALAILVWTALAWLVLPRLGLPPEWGAPLLFVGLGLILVESTTRRARLR